MDWIEVTAKTVDAAKELALDRLGVVEDELEFEVIDEPRSGFLRRSDARIRARVRPLSREKPVGPAPPAGRRASAAADRAASGGRERSSAHEVADDRAGDGRPATATAAAERPGGSGPSRPRRRGAAGRRWRTGSAGAGAAAAEDSDVRRRAARPAGPRTRTRRRKWTSRPCRCAEQAELAATFADELVRAMGFQATVRTEIDEDDLTVQIEGDNLGVLVGPRRRHAPGARRSRAGRGAAQRRRPQRPGPRRRRRLPRAAARGAGRVRPKSRGRGRRTPARPASLEPMNAADRKVVHDAFAEVDGVATGSEGEEPAPPGRDPARVNGSEDLPLEVLERAQAPRVSRARARSRLTCAHAAGFADVVEAALGRPPDVAGRPRARAAAFPACARGPLARLSDLVLIESNHRRSEYLRAAVSDRGLGRAGSTVFEDRAEVVAHDPAAPGAVRAS